LSLLSVPLNVHILTALEEEPLSLTDLRRATGSPPQTTLRGHLRNLTELGILERSRRNSFPGPVDFELGRPGRELIDVARLLQGWLGSAPDGPLVLGSIGARSTIKALVDGWSAAIIRALAARPLSLTELNRLIADLNYPSLERRLGAMRLAGQIKATPSNGRGTPYAVTSWLRRAVAPLAAAARWERRFAAADSAPIGRLDVESIFLLGVPLVRLPADVEGVCRLAVEVRGEGGRSNLAGVMVDVREGRIASCVARLQGNADAWASGSSLCWIEAIIDHDVDGLEIGGDGSLAMTLLDGLNGTLLRVAERT
jgi:DNA-binding HxlR family transcriptional regulator